MDVDFYNFPHGMTLDRIVGRDFDIGNNTARITQILSESDKTWYNERWGVFEATLQGSWNTVILKMRFQLNPSYRNQMDLPIIELEAKEKFDDECLALEECDSSGATPHLLFTQEALVQTNIDIYPGGYIRAIMMGKVPGTSLIYLLEQLRDDERLLIRDQLVLALESMRQKNWNFAFQETHQIFYDREARKMWLVGLSRAGRNSFPPEQGRPITVDSVDVTWFGRWW